MHAKNFDLQIWILLSDQNNEMERIWKGVGKKIGISLNMFSRTEARCFRVEELFLMV